MFSAYRYRVFLSCSHRDKAWGKWLQAALEAYPVADDMVGRQTPAGPVPRTLRPICRDLGTSAADLPPDARTVVALRASQHLVVLCSPHAASSRRVNEVVRRFILWGRADAVIPVILDGAPGDRERECLPPALRFRLDPDRPLLDRRGEPLAADAALARDGRARVTYKVVAAVLCLGLQEVESRGRAVSKRRWSIRAGGVAAALLAAAPGGEAGLAWARNQLSGNEVALDGFIERAASFTGRALAASTRIGVPPRLLIRVLEEAEEVMHGVAQLGSDTPRLRLREAGLLSEFARLYATLGSSDLPGARAVAADRLMQQLAAETADNAARQAELAANYDKLGEALEAQGRFREALASYRAGLAIAERLASDPALIDRQQGLALAYVKVGDAQSDLGALGPALASYNRALIVAEYLSDVDPGRAQWQHTLLLAHRKIGDVLRLRGEADAAIASYRVSQAIALRLLAADPAQPQWRRSLAVSHLELGSALVLQGKPGEAFEAYAAAKAIMAELVALDAGNADWQKDIAVVHERIGLLLEARGDLDAAQPEYLASLAIAGRLAAAHPGNAGWQRDLGIAHQHVGDLFWLRGAASDALDHYRANRAIIERLAALNPEHAGWQYDLGASHARMGLLLETGGEFEAALREYEGCLRIGSRFAEADPGNTGAQRDLAVSYGKLAGVRHRLGKSGQALADLRKAREIIAALTGGSTDSAQWAADLLDFDGRIAALQGRGRAVADKAAPPSSPAATTPPAPRPPTGLRAAAPSASPPKL